MGARQSKPHQGQKKYTKHWMNSLTERLAKKVLGVLGPSEVMPLWRRFKAAIGGDANWDVNVYSFPSMSSTRYIKLSKARPGS